MGYYDMRYSIETYALNGSIHTEHFGENLNDENMDTLETDIYFWINVITPPYLSFKDIQTTTFYFEVDRIPANEAGRVLS